MGYGSSVAVSYGVGSGVAVVRVAAAALIQPLAWDPPYAMGVALKSKKKIKKLFKKVNAYILK